jgi:SAM-dependent methyltransferase
VSSVQTLTRRLQRLAQAETHYKKNISRQAFACYYGWINPSQDALTESRGRATTTTASLTVTATEPYMTHKTNQQTLPCPICAATLPAKVTSWTFYCDRCDYWGSTLQPVTALSAKDDFLAQAEQDNVINPIQYLDDLRVANFRRVLRYICEQKPTPSGTVLEVGCGPGLFLTEAKAAGVNAIGIEPSEAMARRGRMQGCKIRHGLFPDCLEEHEQFDAIVFNDVFEHLSNAPEVLRTCVRHLIPGGLVVLNIPNSHGVFFRVARLAATLGYEEPWNRMWQKMFYTPHLHYVSPKSLGTLCTTVGLEKATNPISLLSVTRRGLWKRIRAAPNTTLPGALLSYAGALCCTVFVPFFDSDCYLQLFRKPQSHS